MTATYQEVDLNQPLGSEITIKIQTAQKHDLIYRSVVVGFLILFLQIRMSYQKYPRGSGTHGRLVSVPPSRFQRRCRGQVKGHEIEGNVSQTQTHDEVNNRSQKRVQLPSQLRHINSFGLFGRDIVNMSDAEQRAKIDSQFLVTRLINKVFSPPRGSKSRSCFLSEFCGAP